jgi:hypothetical protein
MAISSWWRSVTWQKNHGDFTPHFQAVTKVLLQENAFEHENSQPVRIAKEFGWPPRHLLPSPASPAPVILPMRRADAETSSVAPASARFNAVMSAPRAVQLDYSSRAMLPAQPGPSGRQRSF